MNNNNIDIDIENISLYSHMFLQEKIIQFKDYYDNDDSINIY